MLKEKLSKISTKVFYILFALVVSIALWMYVEITENEMLMHEVTGIEIIQRNEEILRDKGLLVTSTLPESLSLAFEGSRSDITRLMAADAVTVEIDLSNIASAGTTQLAYDVILPPNVSRNAVNITNRSAYRVTLVVDRLLDRQIPVVVNYTGGTASEELSAEPAEFDPQMVRVWGPEEVVLRINHIFVPILRENLSSTITEEFEFILVDDNGAEMHENLRESIEFSHETIRVTVPIRQIKDVPLTVVLSHGTSTSDANTNVTVTPQVIKVSGDPDVIRDLNNIMLGTIDMLRYGLTGTEAFQIIIPNHITNISGETEALVLVEVLGLDIAFRSTSNLQTINTPPGFRAEILTQSLDVRIRGHEEDLDLVGPMNIRVVADLADFSTGTASVPAKVFIDGIEADIDAVGDYRITVTIIAEE